MSIPSRRAMEERTCLRSSCSPSISLDFNFFGQGLQHGFGAEVEAEAFHASYEPALMVARRCKVRGEGFVTPLKVRPISEFVDIRRHYPHLARRKCEIFAAKANLISAQNAEQRHHILRTLDPMSRCLMHRHREVRLWDPPNAAQVHSRRQGRVGDAAEVGSDQRFIAVAGTSPKSWNGRPQIGFGKVGALEQPRFSRAPARRKSSGVS